MWTCELPEELLTLTLCFLAPVHLSALVIWNYNGSIENLDCGVRFIYNFVKSKKIKLYFISQVKFIKLKIDDQELVERGTVQVRRGPGHCRYNFGQKIPLLPKHCSVRSEEFNTINLKRHLSMLNYVIFSVNNVCISAVLIK